MTGMLKTYRGPITRIEAVRFLSPPEQLGLKMQAGYEGERGVAAIFKSHEKALKFILKNCNRYPVCIMEDDVYLKDGAWSEEIPEEQLPTGWDLIAINPRFRKRPLVKDKTQKKEWEMPLEFFEPQPLEKYLPDFIITGAHLIIFRNASAITAILEKMRDMELHDVDTFYFENFNAVGVRIPGVRTMGFPSDHGG